MRFKPPLLLAGRDGVSKVSRNAGPEPAQNGARTAQPGPPQPAPDSAGVAGNAAACLPVIIRDGYGPDSMAASAQSRWPPTRRSRGAALTLTLNAAGPLTGAHSRWRGAASPARLTHVATITTYLAMNRR